MMQAIPDIIEKSIAPPIALSRKAPAIKPTKPAIIIIMTDTTVLNLLIAILLYS